MVDNKKTGRAIADIRGVYFYKHDGGEPTINAALLASSDWFAVLTLRGTVNAAQDAPSITSIHVDQFDPAIGITTEPGDFTFEAFLPDMTKDAIAQWIDPQATSAAALTAEVGGETRHGFGYDLEGKLYDRTVLIQTRTGDIFIFSRAQLSFSFGAEDKTYGFRLNGQVMAATNAANKMVYLLTNVGAAPSSSAE